MRPCYRAPMASKRSARAEAETERHPVVLEDGKCATCGKPAEFNRILGNVHVDAPPAETPATE